MSQLQGKLQSALQTHYTLERELTGGGMARVFVAEETALGRKVVVKVLPVESPANVSLERFRREVSLAAQLQHPHIVPLLTAGDADGIPYFTMPYVRGESLRARLNSGGELPLPDAVRLLRQVASALAFAHDADVVHRDIKPENVLVNGDAAMVTDFGVAKALTESATGQETGLTSLGVALGTPAYMSPEQASADPHIDHRSDIYSWGVLAYEVLTGSTPFSGRSPQALLAAHISETPPDIAQRRPAIPAPLARLVMRCLEKRAADRPQHAREVLQALDGISTPSGGLAPADPARLVTPRRMLVASIVAAVVIIGAGSLALWGGPRTPSLTSVAVLPFEVAGGDTAFLYLAEGLGDRLSADLQRRGVHVSPRSTTNMLRARQSDPLEIARALKVSSVFIGSIRPRGQQLHVVYDLISTDGKTLTQGSLDTEASDAQGLKDEILGDLLGVFARKGRSAISRRAVQPDVYDLYLRGLHLRSTFTKDGIERAIQLFKEAIARDSMYAPLYSDLGWAYMQLADGYLAPREVIPQATQAVERALALDDSLAQAHTNLAALYQQYLFNWEGAQREVDRALALDPDAPEPYLWRAAGQLTRGDLAATQTSIQRALELDPLSAFINFSAVWFYTYLNVPDSAISRYNRLQELAPGFFYLDAFVEEAYRMKGQLDSALAISEWGSKQAGRPLGSQVLVLVQMGRRAEAEQLFKTLEETATRQYIPPEILARAALALGDKEKAITYLERGADAQSALVQMVAWMPDFRALQGNPRFERYLRRVRLADAFHNRR